MNFLALEPAVISDLLGEAIESAHSKSRKRVASVSLEVDCADPVALVFA